MDDLWEATVAQVELPESLRSEYFGAEGSGATCTDNRRSFHRYHMRSRAVLKRGKAIFGTLTKDVSRQGVAFLSPIPLLPKERIKLRVPAAELSLEVNRCRRVGQNCFECGAKFAL